MKKCTLSFLFVFVLLACNDTRETATRRIGSLRNELMSDSVSTQPNPQKVMTLIDAYMDYCTKFPEDTVVASYQFEIGNLYRAVRLFDKAISSWDFVLKNYPDSRQAPQSMFLKAFVYENDLGQFGLAKETYREFMKTYPTHEMVDDARFLEMNVGKSAEELLKIIESKQDTGQVN